MHSSLVQLSVVWCSAVQFILVQCSEDHFSSVKCNGVKFCLAGSTCQSSVQCKEGKKESLRRVKVKVGHLQLIFLSINLD